MRHIVMRSAGSVRERTRNMTAEADCRCRGRGVYVVTPEECGYHRAPSLDRIIRRPPQKVVFGRVSDPIDVVLPMVRLSTAYVNERGTVHHFAADDGGGFGRRCEEHGKFYSTNGELNGFGLHSQNADVPITQIGTSSANPHVQF